VHPQLVIKLTTPRCDKSANVSTWVSLGSLELVLLRSMRVSCFGGFAYAQSHAQKKLWEYRRLLLSWCKSVAKVGALEVCERVVV